MYYKKLLLLAAFGVAGVVSANLPELESSNNDYQLDDVAPSCIGVESDCGQGGIWYACAERNSDGIVDHEVKDEMRPLLNEAFCDR